MQVEAILRRMSPKDLVNMLIIENMSPKAREFIDTTPPEPIATKSPRAHNHMSPTCGAATGADKRKRLADNPDALQAIRDMWQSGEHNGAKIAREIGYPRATVAENIKKMKDKGDLPG